MAEKGNVAKIATRLAGPFKHLVLEHVDDYCAYLVRIEGTYLFHQHHKDEMYLVLEGEMAIDYDEDTSITLAEMESVTVRAAERHRSRSDQGALVLMFKARDLFVE